MLWGCPEHNSERRFSYGKVWSQNIVAGQPHLAFKACSLLLGLAGKRIPCHSVGSCSRFETGALLQMPCQMCCKWDEVNNLAFCLVSLKPAYCKRVQSLDTSQIEIGDVPESGRCKNMLQGILMDMGHLWSVPQNCGLLHFLCVLWVYLLSCPRGGGGGILLTTFSMAYWATSS